MSTDPNSAAPIATDGGWRSRSTSPQPRKVDADKLNAHYLSVDSLLTEAEDATVELGKREAARAAIYADDTQSDAALAEKYGVA
ncbi:hypothetical protein [Branchiibius sp. NY16-3462-2]|uniref:hypothetical protein n=1 Tax=Branchiibius sp. NY16-3462-2 TaxID=1807500 RepID=UPI00079912F0|nr:hypothetical protein [Branchiibius sp. NY16-3462-2]KYH43248.1 hypothetical protein AZH51_12905 [Branchiibius sp. NY16-3462-2]